MIPLREHSGCIGCNLNLAGSTVNRLEKFFSKMQLCLARSVCLDAKPRSFHTFTPLKTLVCDRDDANHRLKSTLRLHPLSRLDQKTFTRPHTRVGMCLNAHGDEVVAAVALICARIVADDVLLSQVSSDLHERIVQILG